MWGDGVLKDATGADKDRNVGQGHLLVGISMLYYTVRMATASISYILLQSSLFY